MIMIKILKIVESRKKDFHHHLHLQYLDRKKDIIVLNLQMNLDNLKKEFLLHRNQTLVVILRLQNQNLNQKTNKQN